MKRWLFRVVLLIVGLVAIIAAYLFIPIKIKPAPEIKWGVTFTKSYAEYLGLDWQQVYLATLNDLKIKAVRVGINWDEIEKEPGKFDFVDYDWMFTEAQKRGVEVLPAVGFKLPRWPECRAPQWAEQLSQKDFEQAQLNIVEATVEHFKKYQNIKMWQMENEAFIEWFGDCPEARDSFVRAKVNLVRQLDPLRPIIMTESGELSTWLKSSWAADVLGVSLYRRTWNKFYGYADYHFPPSFYTHKAWLAKFLTPQRSNFCAKKESDLCSKTIITELQLEAWVPEGVLGQPIEEQLKFIDTDRFNETIDYARRTGFDTVYTWGVEWWYWLKQKGHPELWEAAKASFNAP